MLHYLQKNISITGLSNYKTPASALYYFEVKNIQDIYKLSEIYAWANKNNLPILIVSGGTNMLFAFDQYPGIIIYNTMNGWKYDTTTQCLFAYGAESIWNIAEILEKTYQQNIWHRFIGLPGSIAGAIYGNAGCFGLEIENNFQSSEVFDTQSGKILTLVKQDMNFSYRYSLLKDKKHFFLISAYFDLSTIVEKYSSSVDNIYFRNYKQPKGNSCGSFFKNPKIDTHIFIQKYPYFRELCGNHISAGFLLEQAGLKGYTYGGAYFSKMHANFLMHDGTGKWTDLLYLIRFAQDQVYKKFGIYLENEVQIIIP